MLPEHLNFPPYQKHEIQGVLESRLESVEQSNAIAKGAISTVAQKIGNISGDMRKAMDCCQVAMKNVEKASSGKIQVGVADVLQAGMDNISNDNIRLQLLIVKGLASHRNSKTKFYFYWWEFYHIQYFYLAKSLPKKVKIGFRA